MHQHSFAQKSCGALLAAFISVFLFVSAAIYAAAATFDADLTASSTNTWAIGTSAAEWKSLNNTIFFSGANVGISAAAITPSQRLEVDGGLRLNTSDAKPVCAASVRGTFWVTQSGAGMKDKVEVCIKDSTNSYIWSALY